MTNPGNPSYVRTETDDDSFQKTPPNNSHNGDESNSRSLQSSDARPWPLMGQKAFYGLFGRIVGLIAPATEADPVAILAQLLTAFGNVVGRRPYFDVEPAQHRLNLFQCIVGRSAKGRKGTSLNHITRFLFLVDPD
jgi:hypothetical protein